MIIKSKTLILILIPLFSVNSLIGQNQNYIMEETKIKNLVERSYLNGALNEMNTEAMYKGYHPDFAIFFSEGKALKKLPLNTWAQLVKQYKNSGDTSGLRTFSYEFLQIDVTETAAFVKLNLVRDNQLIFTDYITLLKFENEWKIVTKIYHAHIENPWKL